MRGFLLLVFAGCAVGQSPRVEITNISRAGSKDFQVGDRIEIVVSGGANQAVSLRTTRQGQTDWGPVIGWTDLAGKWVWNGEFRKDGFRGLARGVDGGRKAGESGGSIFCGGAVP